MKRSPLILCIDSNTEACEILETLMRFRGFEVISKQTGLDALQLARTTQFSAIVSEYLLGDIDALDLCLEIKKLDPAVPIVFYSTESRNEHRERVLSGGAEAFLVKPNDLDNIEKTLIDVVLKSRGYCQLS